MTNKEKLKTLFSDKRDVPPMFADSFREMGPEWKQISGIDFETTGRVLICHLIIEHYLTKLIELQTPKEFDWTESRMTFSQKLKLIKRMRAFEVNNFLKGVEILNKIRNKFSHNLLASIDESYLKELNKIIHDFHNKEKYKEIDEIYEGVAIIEAFTSLICAFIAGYCSSLVHIEKTRGT